MLQKVNIKVEAAKGLDVQDIKCLCCHRSFCHLSSDHPLCIPEDNRGMLNVWVAQADGRIVGFVVSWGAGQEISHIWEPRIHEQFETQEIANALVRTAIESAKTDGCLKVVLHNVEASKETMEMMKRGFIFSRKRDRSGEFCLEFYLDLYKTIESADSPWKRGDVAGEGGSASQDMTSQRRGRL